MISDQYASSIVVAGGRTYNGMVVPQGSDSVTVLLTNGKKVQLAREEIEDVQPSDTSAMPTGLLNTLTLSEIADLFAYLSSEPAASVAERPTDRAAQ